MREYVALIEKELLHYIEGADLVPVVRDSMRYSLMAGGKRIRPIIMLLVAEACGGTAEAALPYAAALEMIHTYSLIHDDLPAMDNDDERRGKPSAHIIFGEGNAILAGDALLTEAGMILTGLENRKAASAVMRAAMNMLNGQSLDINVNADEINDDLLKRMYLGKTAGLFEGAVLAGAYTAGEKENNVPGWRCFANDLGLLFQVTDDILDEEQDKREGKLTYLSLHSRKEAEEYAATLNERLQAHLSKYENSASVRLSQLIASLVTRAS